ncbi:MAG: hypothetical protein AB4042_05145 [Leptolyngbyaceae cyanobacterium]
MPLSPSTRQVHHVRLTAPDQLGLKRGALLLEDALHTASILGEKTGKLLLIRRLNVGVIRRDRPSTALSIQIEHHLHQLATDAVYALDSQAIAATAVYFHDAADAHVQLLHQLVQSNTPTAWFWSLAVPHWSPTLDLPTGYRQTLLSLSRLERGTSAIATFITNQLHRQPHNLTSLLQSLTPTNATTLIHSLHLTPNTSGNATHFWDIGGQTPHHPITPSPHHSPTHPHPPYPLAHPLAT